MGEMLQRMSGQELAEWEAYLTGQGRVQAQIVKGVTPDIAERVVWSPPVEDTADAAAPPKRRVKGKG